MATAIIDTAIINATATISDGNSKSANNSNAKEFENIFENITKSFDSKKNSDAEKTGREEKSIKNDSKEKVKENKTETADSEPKAQTLEENSENTKAIADNKVEEKTNKNNPEEINTNTGTQASKGAAEDISANTENPAAAGATQTLAKNDASLKEAPDKDTQTKNAGVFAQNTQNQVLSATAIENQMPLQASVQLPIQIQANVQTPLQAQTQSPTQINSNGNNEVSSMAQAQVNPHTSQILPDTTTNNAANPQTQNIIPQKQAEATTQTPVIKVSTEIIASDVNLNKDAGNISNQETKSLQTSQTLTQEMINETNAKITQVQTASHSNSNNLMNRQNPQEQAIKLSLQTSEKTNNLNGTADTAHLNFDVPIEHVQTKPTQVQNIVQAPKEMNSNEIISQINNKLDNLREEGTTRVNIILKPEGLGRISVELINGKDGLVAKMTTDNADVKQLLDKNIDKLKESIGSQGINVNNVSVKVNETQKQDTTFSFDNKQEQTNQQMSDNSGNTERRESSPASDNSSFQEEKIIADSSIESETDVISFDSEKIDYKV